MLRSFFLSILEQYLLEHTLQIFNFLFLESKLQTIINNTQRTIQKALMVYFCNIVYALSFLANMIFSEKRIQNTAEPIACI